MLVLGLLLPAGVIARMRTAEKAALWQLYEQTDGANWEQNENWALANDPCRLFRAKKPYVEEAPVLMTDEWYEPTPWYGVSCSDPCDDYLDGDACYHGRATALRLRKNGLSGSLDWTGVGAMANLTYVDLAYNSISGSLPTELGLLNNVEFLQFSNSPMAGTLPTERQPGQTRRPGSGRASHLRPEAPSCLHMTVLWAPDQSYSRMVPGMQPWSLRDAATVAESLRRLPRSWARSTLTARPATGANEGTEPESEASCCMGYASSRCRTR